MRFDELKVGEKFRCGGNRYIKKTKSTADDDFGGRIYPTVHFQPDEPVERVIDRSFKP